MPAKLEHAVLGIAVLLFAATFSFGATLRAKCVDAHGNPLSGLKLLLVHRGTGKKIAVVADVSGSITLAVPEGEYAIYRGNGSVETRSATLRLTADLAPQHLVQLGENGEITVKAQAESAWTSETDPSLAPIRDYQVQISPAPDLPAQEFRQMVTLIYPFPAQKGGRFHGSMYEFHRNDNFDARNFFDPVGQSLPEYKRNQFGVNVGAQAGRNLNLLGTYEGLRIIQGSTLLSHIPTVEMKAGDFSGLPFALRDPVSMDLLPGNKIPVSRIHPVASRLLDLIPDPNREDPDRNFVNNRPLVRDRNSLSVRGDYQMKDGSSYFVRFAITNGSDFWVHPLPALGSKHEGNGRNLSASYSQKVNKRLLANWRIEFERSVDFTGSVNAGSSGLLASIGIPGLGVSDPLDEGYPDFRLSGYASFGDPGLPSASTNNRFTYEGSLTFTPQKHTFRVGSGLTANQSNNNRSDALRRGRFTFNGYYSGDAFADFLLGVPDSATRALGTDRADLRRKSWYVFVRDEWKLTPQFSFSGGLNYNYFQPFHSIRPNVSTFYPLVIEPPIDGEIVIAGSPKAEQVGLGAAGTGGMVLPDRNDWAPSLGLAYRPLGTNRFVARSGYSIYYSPLGRDAFLTYLGRNYPFYYSESALSPADRAQISMDAPFSSAAPAELGIRGIEPGLRTSYVSVWSLSLQSEIFHQWHLETGYVGSKATKVNRTLVGNVPLPGPGDVQARRPNPDLGRFTILTGGGAYSWNEFNLGAERRLSDGVSLKTGFSLAQGMSDVYWGNPSNPRNLRAERARFESPSRQFYLNYIVDLPFGKNGRFGRDMSGWVQPVIGGWRLSGITHLQDGSRFTVTSTGDPNNDGVYDDRPDRLGSGVLQGPQRTIDSWFNAADFAAPAPYSYGNSGRNILTGPPYVNWDMSLIKQTRIADGQMLEFRLELFNAFNQVNFEEPSASFGTSLFGKIFGAHRAREIEVALRYSF